jgi:methionyl-tRNA formyltransferase
MGEQDPHIPDLKTLVVGCTPLARKVINCLKEISDIVGIIGLNEAAGRKKSNYDSLGDFENNFDMLWTGDINKEGEWIRDKSPDIIIQCGWSQIFKPKILKIPKKYCLGIHPSPLPKGRGAAIINWKIIESKGQSVHWGNSLFVMESKTDTGAVLDFEPFVIETRDDIKTAYNKVDHTALKMIRRTFPKIATGTEGLRQQDDSRSTRYYKRTPKDGKMDLSWSAVKIRDYVRALTFPYPGAFIETKLGKITLWKVSIDYMRHGMNLKPPDSGMIHMIVRGRGVLVRVGDVLSIWIERVSHNGIEQWADEWARELGLKIGESLIE